MVQHQKTSKHPLEDSLEEELVVAVEEGGHPQTLPDTLLVDDNLAAKHL